MSDPAKFPKQLADVQVSEETRMRHALGLHEEAAAHRRPAQRREHETRGRRFVKDGEVPVVVLNGSREASAPAPAANRMAEIAEALRAERLAHERTEQALREAQASVERLETKLVHAEMAHAEGLAAERQAREAAEQALSAATAARQALEARVAELEAELAVANTGFARAGNPPSSPAVNHQPRAGARPKRHPGQHAVEREPEPVKWWLPSYRTKLRKKK